jgi:CRISPR system Cascade subunit CasA
MQLNLCRDPWLKFQLINGSQCCLPLAELGRADIVDVVMPRPDFYGAAWQLLIGLLQTSYAPQDDDEWLERYESPPDAEELGAALAKLEHAFELFGKGPCFMQDLDLLDDGTEVGISSLLIDAPGGNTLKMNTDLFKKRGQVNRLSPTMAAMALFTLQINAPSGGQGHRTGLRGGGPLTTLVVSSNAEQSLFRKLWLNVLPQDGGIELPNNYDANVFPWLAPTRTSEKTGSEVLLHDESVHPLQQYWAMPRRIRLTLEGDGRCDLSGEQNAATVGSYRTKNYGMNYSGTWTHPLTPYRCDPKKPEQEHFSVKGQPGGIGYRQWHQFLFNCRDQGYLAAAVVDRLGEKRELLRELGLVDHLSVWVFGFDMDNMKARSWHEARMPFLAMNPTKVPLFVQEITGHVEAANNVRLALRKACKNAWFGEEGDTRGDLSFIDEQFWTATQTAFFDLVSTLKSAVEDGQELLPSEACEHWLAVLKNTAIRIFDSLVLSDDAQDKNLKRKLDARRKLSAVKHKSDYLKKHDLENKRTITV